MKRFEVVLGIPILILIIIKIFFIPLGSFVGILVSMITTFSMLTFGLIYLIFGAALFNNVKFKKLFEKESYKGVSKIRIWGAILSGISIFLTMYFIAFKVQSFPGSTIAFYLGVIPGILILVISTLKYFKTKSKYYIRVINRFLIFCAFGLLLFMFSESELRKFRFRNYPEYVKAYEKWESQPENDSLFMESRRIFDSLFLPTKEHNKKHEKE